MNNENQSKPLFRLYRHRRCKSSSDAKSNQMNEVPTGVMSNPPPIVNDDAAIEILGARKRFLRLMFKCQSKTSIGPPSDPIALQTAISSSPSTTNARPEISAELDDGEIQDSPTRKVRIGVISRPSLGSDCIVSSEAPASKTFRRQPQSSSIGAKSILDVRKSLKEMETQLIAATTNGHRIARQKVMHVLLSVTDKENDDDGESLRKELGKLMQKEKTERHQIAIASNPLLIQEDTAGPVDDNMALPPTANKENIPLNISLSNGKKSAKDSDQDIEMALDDLQWTEFVASRKALPLQETSNTSSKSQHQRIPPQPDNVRSRIGESQGPHIFWEHNTFCDQSNRSWWRQHPAKASNEPRK